MCYFNRFNDKIEIPLGSSEFSSKDLKVVIVQNPRQRRNQIMME